MKKNKLFVALIATIGVSLANINAQKTQQSKVSNFKPGWFVGAGGGLNWFLAEGNDFIFDNTNRAIFLKNTGTQGRLFAGYKFNPVLAFKLGAEYNNYVYFTKKADNTTNERDIIAPKLNMDLLLNLSNLKSYDPSRKLNFSLFAGLGGLYLYQNINNSKIGAALRGGAQVDYYLNPAIALNLIADGNILTDNTNDGLGGLPVDVAAGIAVGLTYYLPERTKPKTVAADEKLIPIDTPVEVPVVVPQPEKPQIAAVDTPKQVIPEVKPVVKPVVKPEVQVVAVPEIKENLQFMFNMRNVEGKAQEDKIRALVSYLSENQAAKLILSGYADNASGTEAINNEISRQRALNIASKLVKQYDVDPAKIMVRWFGSSIQPYAETWQNRVVIAQTATAEEIKNFKAFNTVSEVVKDVPGKIELNFNANNYSVSDSQIGLLKEIVKYINDNPNAMLQIKGYASASTGTDAVNDLLSKKRAVRVANMLIKDYGVDIKRIKVSWFGARVQPYSKAAMNQLVVVEAK